MEVVIYNIIPKKLINRKYRRIDRYRAPFPGHMVLVQ